MAPDSKDDAYYRDLYAKDPDFRQLALQDADFRDILEEKYHLDFTNPVAIKQLTKTLLKIDFSLKIELPDDRLCPPVPNRHNYILWLKSLLDTTSYNQPGGKLVGLDIGTGASCIYPLLGCTQRPWSFVATDIDPANLKSAAKNVALNNLQDRIRIHPRSSPTDPNIPLGELGLKRIDFTMTNPPFYESDAEMHRSALKKDRPPHSACTGAPVEMVCDGGEVAFVSRILEESSFLKDSVQWYTAMFGMVTSLEAMVEKLRKRGIDNYAVTEFLQGNKTRRWALAWSFAPMRPAQNVCRGMKATPWRKILPIPVEAEIVAFRVSEGVGKKADALSELIQGLSLISWEWDKELLRGIGRARENVWSRAWRRKRKREEMEEEDTCVNARPNDSEVCIFGFSVSVIVNKTDAAVVCRWREGHDEAIFTSFCGFLKTRLQGQAKLEDTAQRAG